MEPFNFGHREKVAENSKNLARKYLSEGNFGRAFSHYLVALKLNPDWREQLREEFSTVLCKWGTVLDERKRYSDLFKCYEQAVEILPSDVVILNNLASHLLRCGLLKESIHYFRKCLSIDRYYIRAAHNLESAVNLAVENWHFRMLNDEHRNEAFREAIIKKVRKGFDTVLDVGTGTGILSLFCAEGEARHIYACDSSLIMTQIAQSVFLANNSPSITLINKHSTDIRVPQHIPRRVSLLVTETFDAALLGEGLLNTLSHAWKHLLLPPHPKPSSSFTPHTFGLVLPFRALLYATAIQFDPFANDFHLKSTPSSLLPDNCYLFRNSDNYDTAALSRSSYKCLTPTENILRLDFNDPDALEEVSASGRRQVSFKCTTSGRLDCFAVWFDLHLDDDIVLNTGPLSKNNSAWDQAIFPLRRSILLEKNEDVVIEVSFHDGKVNISLSEEGSEGPALELSEGAIRTLRSEKLCRGLERAGAELARRLEGSVRVLDCYPFPVLGVNMMKMRGEGGGGGLGDKLSCVVVTEGEERLVELVGEKWGLNGEIYVGREGGVLEGECLKGEGFDVIVLEFVEASGEIKDGVLLELDRWKSLLKPNGIILPQRVTVMGQFIHSDWLLRSSRVVDDSVTCGYVIAPFINTYQTEHFIDFELKAIEKSVCTEPFELFDLFEPLESLTERTVPVLGDVPVLANAFVYWLKIGFLEGCEEIVTNEEPYHQSAFLFPQREFLESVKFNVIRSNGLFKIELLP